MKCPGQDTQYWKPGAIFEVDCPHCGQAVEFFRDDTARKCGHCGHRFVNPEMDFGCAAYCAYAEQCLGTLPAEIGSQRPDLLKERVALLVKGHFGRDFATIGRITKAARYAEKLARTERGDPGTILPATYLFFVASDGNLAPAGMPAAVERILEKAGAGVELIAAVGRVIRLQAHPSADADINCRVVHDAIGLAQFEGRMDTQTQPGKGADADRPQLYTNGGREMIDVLLSPS